MSHTPRFLSATSIHTDFPKLKTNRKLFSLYYILKTISKFVNLIESLQFFLRFKIFHTGLHEAEKIRLCLLKKMAYLLWLTGGFSRWTYLRPVNSAWKKELCVFHMMYTVQMFKILSKPLGGKVTGKSACLLCTFWRMPLEKFNSNQITIWHVYSFSTVVFSILVESRFYKWHSKCTVKNPWNPGHVMQSEYSQSTSGKHTSC